MNKSVVFSICVLLLTSTFANGQNDQKKKANGRRAGQNGFSMERFLKTLDKNNDGKVSKAEAPDRMKERFGQMDANGDGFIDDAEFKKLAEMRARRGGPNAGRDSAKSKKGNSKGSDAPSPSNSGAARGKGIDIAKMFKEADRDGDGNLSPSEQQTIIVKFKELQNRMRQMRGNAGDAAKKKASDRFAKPNTDPVKPKRPGMEE